MFDYREIENWVSRYDVSDEEADRIASRAETKEEFERIWAEEDWWTDANNDQ